MKLLIALAVFVSVANAGRMYRWKWDSNWLNNNNWESGAAPVNGHYSVTFPKRFGEFNHGRGGAVYLGPTNCANGNSACSEALQNEVSSDNVNGQGFADEIRITSIVLPANGQIELADEFTINFDRPVMEEEVMDVEFKFPRDEHLDWQCAANWAFLRDTSDPFGEGDFAKEAVSASTGAVDPPCADDSVFFPPRSSFLVEIPEDTFINAVHAGDVFTPTAGGDESSSVHAVAGALNWKHQFAGMHSGTTGLTSNSFQAAMCPHVCPQQFSSLRNQDECAALCYNTCPNLLEAACTVDSCPREEAFGVLMDTVMAQESCTVPLRSRSRFEPYGDGTTISNELVSRAGMWTPQFFQGLADTVVAQFAAISDEPVVNSIDVSVNDFSLDLQVQGRIPKDEDGCLAAYEAGDTTEDCSMGDGQWFESGIRSSNSESVAELLSPRISLLGATAICRFYEQTYTSMGHADLGAQCSCVLAPSGLSCAYEENIAQELACYQNYNAGCDAVHDYRHEVAIVLSESQRTELLLTSADLTRFISAQLCQQGDFCMIPANGVSVGEIEDDGTVVIWLNMTSGVEDSEWSLRHSIQEAIRLGEITVATVEAQEEQASAVEAAAASASTSEGGSNLGMFAGVGAVVVIVIVVVIKKRSGDDGGAASRKADRNVVAFENPMYADGKNRGDDDPGGEGLYDEPAFNKKKGRKKKQNPMFDSSEDLTGGDGDGGYLDVVPDEDE